MNHTNHISPSALPLPRTLRVGITGGIGSGKSVVARIMRLMGYPVFDCDHDARLLMDTDTTVRQEVARLLGNRAYATADGTLDRRWTASQIFDNFTLLTQLNAIVHPCVRSRLAQWFAAQQTTLAFVETALLRQAGMESDVNAILIVTAPVEVRLMRVAKRSGMNEQQIRQRINAQQADDNTQPRKNDIIIVNDNRHAVLPQVHQALKRLLAIYNELQQTEIH